MTLSIPQLTFQMRISSIEKFEKMWSPDLTVQNIPFKVQVIRENRETVQSLAVYLHCLRTYMQINELYSASATFKLIPFNNNSKAIVHYNDPCVFDSSEIGCGTNSLIGWSELIDAKSSYVEDNTVVLQINIAVVNPNDKKMSRLNFDTIGESCENSCLAKFRLQITNIKNLMAVRSPLFIQHNTPWHLTGYKDHLNYLGVYLFLKGQKSCTRTMSVKILSFKKSVDHIKETKTENLKPGETLSISKIISWNKLLQRENGFILKNSIEIEVEIALENFNPVFKKMSEKSMKVKDSYYKMKCVICLDVGRTAKSRSIVHSMWPHFLLKMY